MHLTTEIVSSAAEYGRGRDELLDLYSRCGSPWSAVAHPDWVIAWWRSRPSNTRVSCGMVRADGRLVAAVPVQSTHPLRVLPTKAAGTNLAWGWSSSLVDPTADEAWTDALVEWLRESPWSVVELGLFPSDSPVWAQILATRTPSSWHREETSRDIATLPLRPSFDEFLADRPKNLRRKYRRAARSADDCGVRARTLIHPTSEQLDAVIGTITHTSWQGSQDVAVYCDPANRTFYRLLADQPGGLTLALHYREDSRGEPIGYMLSACTGDVMHQIDTAFAPAAASSSPGLLATFDSLRWACDQGLSIADMGIAADYKTRFGPDIVAGRGLAMTRGLSGRLMRRH